MATLSEKFAAIEKAEPKIERSNPSNVVYPSRSGTKDIPVRWNIGGGYSKQKKIPINSTPIFSPTVNQKDESKTFIDQISRPVTTIHATIVKPVKVPKIRNIDTKPVMNESVNQVIGMRLMGGKGIEHAAGFIKKIEEMKVLKLALFEKED